MENELELAIAKGDSEMVMSHIIKMEDPITQAENCRRIIQKISSYDLLSGESSTDSSEQVMLLCAMRDYFLSICISKSKA
jgi:hypothetical protein